MCAALGLPRTALKYYYYTTIGLLVNFGPPRALLLVAAQALGFRSTGRGHPLDSRPGPSGVGVAGSAWGYACGVGDDEVGFAASTNSGDKRRRGVHADSRQGRRWHRSRVVRSVEVVSGCTGRRRCGRTSRRGVSREQGLLLRQLLGPPWWSSCCSSSSAWVTGYLMPSKWWSVPLPGGQLRASSLPLPLPPAPSPVSVSRPLQPGGTELARARASTPPMRHCHCLSISACCCLCLCLWAATSSMCSQTRAHAPTATACRQLGGTELLSSSVPPS